MLLKPVKILSYCLQKYSSGLPQALPVLSDSKTNKLQQAMRTLDGDKKRSVRMLRITECNASLPVCFTRATCDVKSVAQDSKQPQSFPFNGLFLKGKKILDNYLLNRDQDLNNCEQASLQKLIKFLDRKETKEAFLVASSKKSKYEVQWTAALAYYLLSQLAVEPDIVIDKYYQQKKLVYMEESLPKKLKDSFGDTSIGNTMVWHGCADILVGQKLKVQVDVAGKLDESMEDEDIARALLELKTDELCYFKNQLLSEAVVFGCLQRQVCPLLFAPTIGISKESVIFYFYDSVRDILIESRRFGLFYIDKETKPFRTRLAYDTVLALWLALNYRYLSTGVTKSMVNRTDYKANFWEQLPDGVQDIYRNELQFGSTRDCQRSLLDWCDEEDESYLEPINEVEPCT